MTETIIFRFLLSSEYDGSWNHIYYSVPLIGILHNDRSTKQVKVKTRVNYNINEKCINKIVMNFRKPCLPSISEGIVYWKEQYKLQN